MESTNASEGGTPGDRRPVRRRQCDRTALSDARLTEAAIELIVRTGIHRTTLQAVGERAGYSRALATHRFGSKAGLFTHVLKTASADWLNRVQQAVGERVGVDALCAATDAGLRFIRERPDEVRAMYMLWFLSIDLVTDYGPNIASVHRAQRRDAEHWIRAGQDAGQIDRRVDAARVAEQYVASMAGIAYQWLVNDGMDLEAMYGELEENLRARLQPPRRAPAARGRRVSRRAATRAATCERRGSD
ncbi:MAG: helix-turn-helix domain-containing protein [Steroidobacteraceae bacterium]